MRREQRSREKLWAYRELFERTGELDPNVHPWVAASWQRCRERGVPLNSLGEARLAREDFAALLRQHEQALAYLRQVAAGAQDFWQKHALELWLVSADGVALAKATGPVAQSAAGTLAGACLKEDAAGTSSVALALEHGETFWLFGPERWARAAGVGDAASTPVLAGGQCRYVLTLVAPEGAEVPQEAALALLLTLRDALAAQLVGAARLRAEEAILDAAPFAVYHVLSGGEVAYTNRLGKERLVRIGAREEATGEQANLHEVVLNYPETPMPQGFQGVTSYNREVTWVTPARTYEDITTVVPLERDAGGAVRSIVMVSMPIEDMRALVARTAGYTAKYSLGSLVGQSQAFLAMREKAARAAKGASHVLLQGEAGTGKQRLAHGIHLASARAAGPLITLRCGARAPELLEQELFGVAAGSGEGHPGRLELAAGGTLFLDEVEKMPRPIADGLAEALAKGLAYRLGEREMLRPLDVRIIAAADSDLKRLTEQGLFSAELYGLLAKSVVRVPPLRARREDIPELARYFLRGLAEQHGLPEKQLAEETLPLLLDYAWPGNIKQLQGVLEYAFFGAKGEAILPTDISLWEGVPVASRWKEDKEVFQRAWQSAGGNVSRLANLLNVSRVTLYRYLKKYGLERK